MKRTTLALSEIALIAATRGMAGAGAGLLLSTKISRQKRRELGWPLFLIGALTTVPLIINVMNKTRQCERIVEKDS
jgi:hypothetical protein